MRDRSKIGAKPVHEPVSLLFSTGLGAEGRASGLGAGEGLGGYLGDVLAGEAVLLEQARSGR
ncbi:hypothetical protein GCM10011612_14810 [Actinomyces gaoshouyii]|uniref:Uncharacterized protein n=1 Tax=Actinomyces gaoshouyii TaxID=1960083 RepID=A0A8H9H9P2_9ACTO|nr:hypothetical protein GCM10011612_14810 [Actinomyces gaoshouyii]